MSREKNSAVQPCLLWVARGDERYGVLRGTVGFSEELVARGWRVVLLHGVDGPLVTAFAERDWSRIRVADEARLLQVTGSPMARARALMHNRAINIRYVHAAGRSLAVHELTVVQTFSHQLIIAAGSLARAASCPAIWRMAGHVRRNGALSPARLYLHAMLYRWRVLALGTSAFTAMSLGRGPAARTSLAHGVDTVRFDPRNVRAERDAVGVPDAAIVIVLAARFYPNDDKRQLATLRALGARRRSERPVHLFLLGGPLDGAFGSRLKAEAAEAVLNGVVVHMPGPVSDIERYYAVADVAVSAYAGAEAFGLTAVEAMMMGIPVLVHALGGPAETVVDGECGWHVRPADTEALSAGFDRVFADVARWKAMGEAARQRALVHYTLASEVDGWLALTESAGQKDRELPIGTRDRAL